MSHRAVLPAVDVKHYFAAGSTFHAGCRNTTACARRRAVHCAWIDRTLAQQTDQRRHLRPETAARLPPLARYLLDVE